MEGWSTEASVMRLGSPRRGTAPQGQRNVDSRKLEMSWISIRNWLDVDCWLLGNLSWIALRFIRKDQQQGFENKNPTVSLCKGVAGFRVWGRSEFLFVCLFVSFFLCLFVCLFHKQTVNDTEGQSATSATQDGNGTKSVSFLEFAFWYSRPGAFCQD